MSTLFVAPSLIDAEKVCVPMWRLPMVRVESVAPLLVMIGRLGIGCSDQAVDC